MENRDIVHLFLRLTAAHRYEISQAANSVGIYFGQPQLLEYVIKHNGCTQSELSENLHVSPPSVAMSVKRLQKSDLIRKISDKDDLRCNRLSVTDKGAETLESFHRICDETDEKLFSGFSDGEKELLVSFLIRLTNNITDESMTPEIIRSFFENEMKNIRECNEV